MELNSAVEVLASAGGEMPETKQIKQKLSLEEWRERRRLRREKQREANIYRRKNA